MESRGSCTRCTHPVYHEPLRCKHCKGGFCLDCFAREESCVQCHDEVDMEHALGLDQANTELEWKWQERQETAKRAQRRMNYDQLLFVAFCVFLWTCWYFL
jgi:hypothetical protein